MQRSEPRKEEDYPAKIVVVSGGKLNGCKYVSRKLHAEIVGTDLRWW